MGNCIRYNGIHRVFDDAGATVIAHQLDRNAEEKQFWFSRYLDGFDLTGFTAYLKLTGTGMTDRAALNPVVSDEDETVLVCGWNVPDTVTAGEDAVVFQPVFWKEGVTIHLDRDVFTIGKSIDTNEEILIHYPDYIGALAEKADLSAVYCKTQADELLESIRSEIMLPNLLKTAIRRSGSEGPRLASQTAAHSGSIAMTAGGINSVGEAAQQRLFQKMRPEAY